MKIGIIREGKVPADKRVPLTPAQCRELEKRYSNCEIVAEKSPIRAFTNNEYKEEGIKLTDDLNSCDVIMGVKEVPIEKLIPQKTYFFFSHTIKEQPYNRDLLRALVEKKVRMIDYEVIRSAKGIRLIGFGRYAGIVGCYNGFLTYGLKNDLYSLKRAHECHDRKELEQELKKVQLPDNMKIAISGLGRVAKGAKEILKFLEIEQVSAEDFLTKTFDHPVFAQLSVKDYHKREDGADFDRFAFFKNPKGYVSTFPRYLQHADMYVACHYWDAEAPFLFTRDDLKAVEIKTKVIADISCDIDGPIASTIRPSTIEEPLYGYQPQSEKEVDFRDESAIAVMAVDNLPCELPRDASEDFGNELIKKVIPLLLDKDPDGILEKATITNNGDLTANFEYLRGYLEGN